MPQFLLAVSFDPGYAQADVLEVGPDGVRIRYWLQRTEAGWALETDDEHLADLYPKHYPTFDEAVLALLQAASDETLGSMVGAWVAHLSDGDQPHRPP